MAAAIKRQRQSAEIVGMDGRPLRPQARYDAAQHGRRTSGWLASSYGPNREISGNLATLRDRHRDLARNNPWARRAIGAIVTNTVGDGIRAQWSDPAVQELWSRWWESPSIDADGRQNGYGLTGTVLRAAVESGEVLVRQRRRRASDALPVPLQLQVLEPDYLDHGRTEALPDRGWITQGVERSRIGVRRRYWLYPEHPGDPIGHRGLISQPYPAAQFLHVYRLDRPGQERGVPWGTGAMMRLRMLDDYQDAQLERQRIAACYMAFRRPGIDAEPVDLGDITLSEKVEPGLIEDLPQGWDMSFATPPQPEDDKEFQLSVLRAVAADYGIPYEVLTGDLSEVNFSSARMGWNEFARNIEAWRWQLLATQFLEPVAQWFREAASLVGIEVREERPLWTAPARTMVDAAREVPALVEQIRAGLLSTPQAIRQQGYDPEVLLAEQAEWLRRLDAAGVAQTTDPRAERATNTETAND